MVAEILYPSLSYIITGCCFSVHNALGRYAREKQYCDELEACFQKSTIAYDREFEVPETGNRVDFLIEGKIILEAKAKDVVTRDDYYQTQRYLQSANIKLALLVNFRNRYLKPVRIIRIDTDVRKKFA